MKAAYFADVVPGILRVTSNQRRIPGFALCAKPFSERSAESSQNEPPLRADYIVNPALNKDRKAAGKIYSAPSKSETSIQTPIGRLGSLSCLYRHDKHSPTLEVNRLYHRAGRLTIGNVHSCGWLMRDISNILLLQNGYCLLHAAALTHKARTVLIVGLSNTGKSTTSFNLTINGPCQLFGDDLVVTDGRRLFSCPLTGTNVDPSSLPTFRQRLTHWSGRNVPFYEYFGPSPALAVGDYVGDGKMAGPSNATDVLFLRRGSNRTDTRIDHERARSLLLASNRTEFTYMNSAILSAFDYLNDMGIVSDCTRHEEELLGELVQHCSCRLIEGDMDDFRDAVSRALELPVTHLK